MFKEKAKCETQYFILKTAYLKVLKLTIEKMGSAESSNEINMIIEDVLIRLKEKTSQKLIKNATNNWVLRKVGLINVLKIKKFNIMDL